MKNLLSLLFLLSLSEVACCRPAFFLTTVVEFRFGIALFAGCPSLQRSFSSFFWKVLGVHRDSFLPFRVGKLMRSAFLFFFCKPPFLPCLGEIPSSFCDNVSSAHFYSFIPVGLGDETLPLF